MAIIAGCYERFLFGFAHPTSESEQENKLTRKFTHAAHKGVVKSLAAAGPFVASGGTDDLIHLYDLKDDKDLGFLMNPAEGSITSLQFFTPQGAYSPTHLLAGCSDGTISIWKAGGGWECMKTLRGHRKDITGITIHPSGCLALTTSSDKTLRLWDLVKGRTTFSTKIEGEPENVAFSPNGTSYAIQCGSVVTIQPVVSKLGENESGNDILRLQHPRKVQSMIFVGSGDGLLVTGCEDGSLRIWQGGSGIEVVCIPRAHATRIKALAIPYYNNDGDYDDNDDDVEKVMNNAPRLLASASSDGIIKLWKFNHPTKKNKNTASKNEGESDVLVCLSEGATKARLTVLCCVDPVDVMVERMNEVRREKQQQKQKGRNTGEDGNARTENTMSRGGSGDKKERKKGTTAAAKKQLVKKQPAKKLAAVSPVVKIAGNAAETKINEVKKRGKDLDGGVVSFIDEQDVERQRKKQKQVQLKAQRIAKNKAGQKRRAHSYGHAE